MRVLRPEPLHQGVPPHHGGDATELSPAAPALDVDESPYLNAKGNFPTQFPALFSYPPGCCSARFTLHAALRLRYDSTRALDTSQGFRSPGGNIVIRNFGRLVLAAMLTLLGGAATLAEAQGLTGQ